MNKTKQRLLSIFLAFLVFIYLLGWASCTSKENVFVSWFDTDGTLIASQNVEKNYNPTSRALPQDNDLWHYIGWTTSQSGSIIVCTAQRIAKKNIVWKNHDGSIIHQTSIAENEKVPTIDLPQSTEKWIYECWEETTEGNNVVFQAQRKPNTSYFIGNVFQIIVKDASGEPIASGSGFLLNDDGYFITNNHVMSDGYSATAYFDIIDSEHGQKYTKLEVLGGIYYSEEKDIFIGKLEGYHKLKEYYHPMTFTENYTVGESSYSVGYPNSSIKLEINSGKILEEYSNIYDKIDGIYYVLSSSYIAPGSSGGILINENFEIIGITSMGLYSDSNQNHYLSGGSIPYFLFQPYLKNLNETSPIPICELYKK